MRDTLYVSIADAIAYVIGELSVEALNRLAPPPRLASYDYLIGLPRAVIQRLINDRCADFEAGRSDDALRRVYIAGWLGRGVTETEAECIADWLLAALEHDTEARLRARPGGWEPPSPPPPRLPRFNVEVAVGKVADDEWQQGRFKIWHMTADGDMRLVPRSTAWRLCLAFPEGEWVIAQRDRNVHSQGFAGLHTTEAGREVLLNAVRKEVGEKPPLWPKLLTPAELKKRLKDEGVTLGRWDQVHALYVDRLQSFTPSSPPKLELRPNNRDANRNDYDREWAKDARVDTKTELPILRAMYIRPRRKAREA